MTTRFGQPKVNEFYDFIDKTHLELQLVEKNSNLQIDFIKKN